MAGLLEAPGFILATPVALSVPPRCMFAPQSPKACAGVTTNDGTVRRVAITVPETNAAPRSVAESFFMKTSCRLALCPLREVAADL
jgi:hypothetical protein